MKRSIAPLLLALTLSPLPARAQAPAAPAPAAWKQFQDLSFLVGSWSGTAESSGRIGGRVIRFAMELGGNYMVAKGSTIFAAQGGKAEETIEEVGYIAYDRERRVYVAQYYFSNGISGTFDVEVAPDGLKLVSSSLVNYETGAKARMGFRKTSDTEIASSFDLAPGGKEFVPFLTAKLTKK